MKLEGSVLPSCAPAVPHILSPSLPFPSLSRLPPFPINVCSVNMLISTHIDLWMKQNEEWGFSF